jgi:hypothetical protein
MAECRLSPGRPTTWYSVDGYANGKLLDMQVPPDLASRLSSVAILSGRSPEAFLREAISRLIDSTAQTLAPVEDGQHTGFVPQPQSFSVYE